MYLQPAPPRTAFPPPLPQVRAAAQPGRQGQRQQQRGRQVHRHQRVGMAGQRVCTCQRRMSHCLAPAAWPLQPPPLATARPIRPWHWARNMGHTEVMAFIEKARGWCRACASWAGLPWFTVVRMHAARLACRSPLPACCRLPPARHRQHPNPCSLLAERRAQRPGPGAGAGPGAQSQGAPSPGPGVGVPPLAAARTHQGSVRPAAHPAVHAACPAAAPAARPPARRTFSRRSAGRTTPSRTRSTSTCARSRRVVERGDESPWVAGRQRRRRRVRALLQLPTRRAVAARAAVQDEALAAECAKLIPGM